MCDRILIKTYGTMNTNLTFGLIIEEKACYMCEKYLATVLLDYLETMINAELHIENSTEEELGIQTWNESYMNVKNNKIKYLFLREVYYDIYY